MHKIIFFGTSLISAKILQYLLTDKEVEVLAVVCQPDQKKIPETKKVALQNNLKFYQPEKLKTIFEELKGLQSDLILTCSYGKIIPRIYLNMPKYKCINIHTSLLPKLRGPNPIRYAILQNEKKTGVTLMYMEEGLDTGNIIFQQEVEITSKETYSTLYEKLSEASIQILKQHLHSLFSDNVISYKQIEENATFCEKLTREKEKIDWEKTIVEIDCLVRSLKEEPIAFVKYEDLEIKIHNIEIFNSSSDSWNELWNNNKEKENGTILKINKEGIFVKAKDGIVIIDKLQLPSKKPVLVKDMINGRHIFLVDKKFI